MNTWKIILATMVIFAAGVVTGGLLVKKTSLAEAAILPQQPHTMRFEALRMMSRELNLTAAQQLELGKLIDEARDRVGIWTSLIEPETQDELRKLREDVRARLTPEQRQRFEEMMRARTRKQVERARIANSDTNSTDPALAVPGNNR